MSEHLTNAEGMLKACADWHTRTGGTLPVRLTCHEAAAVTKELATLRLLHASEKQAKIERGDMYCECMDKLTALHKEFTRFVDHFKCFERTSSDPADRLAFGRARAILNQPVTQNHEQPDPRNDSLPVEQQPAADSVGSGQDKDPRC